MNKQIVSRIDFLQSATGGLDLIKSKLLGRIPEMNASSQTPEKTACDEDFWVQIKHAYTIARNHINLNSGSVNPAPRVVQ